MPPEENHGVSKPLFPFIPRCLSPLVTIFLDSFKIIFLDNPKLFFTIYVVAALPLSVLLTNLSLSSTPRHLKAHIARLEWLVHAVPIWIEANNVREESQADLKRLYRYKAVHAIPMLIFSLVTLVVTVTSTSLACSKKRPTLRTAMTALRVKCVWPMLTCIVIFSVWIVWGHVLPILTAATGYPAVVGVVAAAVVVEVYIMAVFSLALVVSVVEERNGVDAVRVGSGLMKERRVCGWVLAGLILLCSGYVGRELVDVMDGQDLGINGGYKWTTEMKVGYMIGLILLLGLVVLWSYVVITVFYCDCRKLHVIREGEQLDGDIEL